MRKAALDKVAVCSNLISTHNWTLLPRTIVYDWDRNFLVSALFMLTLPLILLPFMRSQVLGRLCPPSGYKSLLCLPELEVPGNSCTPTPGGGQLPTNDWWVWGFTSDMRLDVSRTPPGTWVTTSETVRDTACLTFFSSLFHSASFLSFPSSPWKHSLVNHFHTNTHPKLHFWGSLNHGETAG